MPVSPTLRAKILAEARYRCGYCLTQQIAVNWLLEVEHIILMDLKDGDEVVVALHKVTAAGVSLPAEA